MNLKQTNELGRRGAGQVEMNRKLSMVKAWEENHKSKADNRFVSNLKLN
jgi:hypothetical protein